MRLALIEIPVVSAHSEWWRPMARPATSRGLGGSVRGHTHRLGRAVHGGHQGPSYPDEAVVCVQCHETFRAQVGMKDTLGLDSGASLRHETDLSPIRPGEIDERDTAERNLAETGRTSR